MGEGIRNISGSNKESLPSVVKCKCGTTESRLKSQRHSKENGGFSLSVKVNGETNRWILTGRRVSSGEEKK